MPESPEPIEIVVCLGSSCFARGNSDNLAVLKEYAAGEAGVAVHLAGSLCQDRCRQSPNVRIAGRYHDGVTPDGLRTLLSHIGEPWDETWTVPMPSELRGERGTA